MLHFTVSQYYCEWEDDQNHWLHPNGTKDYKSGFGIDDRKAK